MKSRFRMEALLLALVMTLGFRTFPSATAFADANTPMEISVTNWDIDKSFDPNDNERSEEMTTYLEEMFNIKFNPFVLSSVDADTKIATWAASGSLPDIIGARAIIGTSVYFQWINDGLVRALPDDLSAYPHIAPKISDPSVAAYQVDGKSYYLPRSNYMVREWGNMDRGLISRKDWREKLGLDVPKTQEEFIAMAVAFATQDPDGDGENNTIGLTGEPAALTSQAFAGFGFVESVWVKQADGSVVMASMEESALSLCSFLRELNRAGGLDPDFATNANTTPRTSFAVGKAGILATGSDPSTLTQVMTEWETITGNPPFVDSIEHLNPPPAEGKEYNYLLGNPYWSETYINATVDDAKMAKILELFDYLYSEPGLNLLAYGFEGKDWEKEDGEIKLLTDLNEKTGQPKAAKDLYKFANGGMSILAAWGSALLMFDNPTIPKELRDMSIAERDRRIAEWKAPNIDNRILAIDIPEKGAMGSINQLDDWVRFIANTSDKTDQELYDEMYQNWLANGYQAAKDAMTAKVAELGY